MLDLPDPAEMYAVAGELLEDDPTLSRRELIVQTLERLGLGPDAREFVEAIVDDLFESAA